MKKAIKDYSTDFIAIVVLALIATLVGGYILSNQRFYLPAWVPFVGTDFYALNAEMQTAQAITPGQGQTVAIAGVPVGEITGVKLVNGRAVTLYRLALLMPEPPLSDRGAEREREVILER